MADYLFNRQIGVYLYFRGAEHLTAAHKLVKKVIGKYPESNHLAPLIESHANINFSQVIDKNKSKKKIQKKLQSSIEGFKRVLELERSPIKCGEVAKKLIKLYEIDGSKAEATKLMKAYSNEIEAHGEWTNSSEIYT